MRKKISILGIIATLALVLSGCMRMHINLAITEDDTINGEIIMAFEDEAIRGMGMEPSEAWDSMGGDSLLDSFPTDQGTIEDYTEDGFTGKRIVLNETPLSAFSGDSQDGSLGITREGGEFVVTGELDLTDQSGSSDSIPSYLLDTFDIKVTIAFPGKVTESSGEINGNQTTWIAKYGEVTAISARGGATGSGGLTRPTPSTSTSPAATPTAPESESPSPTPSESESASPTPSESATTDSDDDAAASDSEDNGTNWLLWGGIAAGALALIALITIFIATGRKKDGDPNDPNFPASGPGGYPGQPGAYPGHTGPIAPVTPGAYPGQPQQDHPTQQLPPQQYPTQQLPPVSQPPQYPTQQQPPGGQPPAPSGPSVPGQDPTQQLPPTPPAPPAQ